MMKKSYPKNPNRIITYRFDATKTPLGRLASEVTKAVQGKLLPSYRPEKISQVRIIIQNINQVAVSGKKINAKKYFRYTGYPGGIKSKRMGDLFKSNPQQFFINVVKNMLPNNKLRIRMIKKIQFM